MSEHKGCGCIVCQRAMPNPEPQDVITAQMRQDVYEADRAAYRVLNPHRTWEEIEESA